MTYDSNIHGFVAIGGDLFPIVLHLGDRIWVHATGADQIPHLDVVLVRDGIASPFDRDGSCVLSVPVARVTRYLEPTEAIAEEAAKEPRSAHVNDRRV